jgi:hypothetical protein
MRKFMLLPAALLGLGGCAVPVQVPAGSQVTAASISPAPAGSLSPTVSASYVAPATTYVTPGTTYVTPSATYVTPSTAYVTPGGSYVTSTPATTYVAPAQTTTTYMATVPTTTQYVVPAIVGADNPSQQ